MAFTDACAGLQIVSATFRASGQTLINLLVNGAAIFALPASFAYEMPVKYARNDFQKLIHCVTTKWLSISDKMTNRYKYLQ